MLLEVQKSPISGTVSIPGSKSHTIRALILASLASGRSVIRNPLDSKDARSAVVMCRQFGAAIEERDGCFFVDGFGGTPAVPDDVIDTGNSGTSILFGMGVASLCNGTAILTGDQQIRRRPVGNLADALTALGAESYSSRRNGLPPVVVNGPAQGGHTDLAAPTSQYLSSLLICAPLYAHDTHIHMTELMEIPYIEMTLWWLDKSGIAYNNDRFEDFRIVGRQRYNPFDITIPGDFSSATFFAVLAAISGGEIYMQNLDMTDPQGDKAMIGTLESMGAEVVVRDDGILVRGRELIGREIDMNATPDAICAMAVAGCFAEGETRLVNVPQARLKETDRIAVMREELAKMGADIVELNDGLAVRKSALRGAAVHGHHDHRVVMSMTIAGLCAEGQTSVDTAEAMCVTFPDFVDLVHRCGGNVTLKNQ